ncbi:unnamed protein product [Calicophoron daubneyi]|uniref:SH3 domain-containing protein n=1 Tax=Calicophoron daubneyi TaxID=300641 RepID=A0AAV2T6H9_CALDB
MEVVVEYDYAAEEPDELTIKKGDIIKEVSQFEEGWYIGNLNGKIGVFPDNFVRSRTPVSDQKKLGQSTVEMVKEPIGDSSYDNGRGSAAGKHVTGIGLGNIFSGEPIQLKQPKLKDMMKESESNSERTTVVTKGDGPRSAVTTDLVRARFDYQPKQTDELELRVDDVIQVIDRDLPDEGWWKGKNLRSKKIGLFPDNFVSSTTTEPPEESDNRAQTEPPADTGADADIPQQTLRAPADKTSHSNAATPNSLTVSNMDNQAPPDVGEIRRSYTTSRIADQTSRSQRINIPGQVRSDFLHRSEGGSGSADLIRTGDVAVNKNSSGDGQQQQQQQSQQPQQQQWQALEKLQSQYEQLQAHHNQHVNESKQQIRELKRHLDQLRESHSQLRSDMIQNQRAMTERLQTLMNEVDDAKKQRASDAIELTRLRTMLMQLDAKSLITPNLGQGYSSTKHHRPSVDRSEENGNSRNDDDPEETNNESLRSPVNRSADGKGTEHTNLNNAQAIGNKITSTGRTAPPLRPRPTHTPKYLHT